MRRVISIVILFAFIINYQVVFAVEVPQPPVKDLKVTKIGSDSGMYFDLSWSAITSPKTSDTILGQYINIYLDEITKPYKPAKTSVVAKKDISGNDVAATIDTYSITGEKLTSGTMYECAARAYYKADDGTVTYNSSESVRSNVVKFLTDISINAYTYSTSQIKIVWDDVWDKGKRIDYKLYLSDNRNFANTNPIYLGQNDVDNGAVTVDMANGKLEYLYTVDSPGKIMYAKIQPFIQDSSIIKNLQSSIVSASSYISLTMNKVSTGAEFSVWKMEWTPVVTTSSTTSNTNLEYEIYKSRTKEDASVFLNKVTDTSFMLFLEKGTNEFYFFVQTTVTQNNTTFIVRSERVTFKESDISHTPTMVEFRDSFLKNSSDETSYIVSYSNQLKPTSATVLWELPINGQGEFDNEVKYDIWLISNPDWIDNPPETNKIAKDYSIKDTNIVSNGTKAVGIRYDLLNLTQNSTYYFKIIAKRVFTEFVDSKIKQVTYSSLPAVKTIITPSVGNIESPIAPGIPPLSVKKIYEPNEKTYIETDNVTLQLKNLWYEEFDFETNKWKYIRTEKLKTDDTPPYILEDLEIDNIRYRKVEYDSDIVINVGIVEYEEGITYEKIKNYPTTKVTNFLAEANDNDELEEYNPDGMKHNIDIVLKNLKQNTTYIIWVRAARKSNGYVSDPSDPLVVTTKSVEVNIPEQPLVPNFTYGIAGDNYVDVGWDLNSKYKYSLRYGIVDDVTKATNVLSLTQSDFAEKIYYRINKLKPNTRYYFFVQAIIEKNKSNWSDSLALTTLPFQPPDPPTGFGVKEGTKSIGKDFIIFAWIKLDGMKYKLEYSDNIDFKDSKMVDAGKVSEYNLMKLKSNRRYYARLYAKDIKKNAESKPTAIVSVITEKSTNEYDTDVDTSKEITGDIVSKSDTLEDYVYYQRIVGINADRFVELIKSDNSLNYTLDLSNPLSGSEKTSVVISGKVFEALNTLKENIILKTKDENIIIRNNSIKVPEDGENNVLLKDYNFQIDLSDSDIDETWENYRFKGKAKKIEFLGMRQSNNKKLITNISRPLILEHIFNEENYYKEGTTFGMIYNSDSNSWSKLDTYGEYNPDNSTGKVVFNVEKSGEYAISDKGENFYDDINDSKYKDSINKLTKEYNLKSIVGREFNPDDNITGTDCIKMVFDIYNYNYDNNFLNDAIKIEMIDRVQLETIADYVTMEQAVNIAYKLYEMRTNLKAKPSNINETTVKDADSLDFRYKDRVLFAAENGSLLLNEGNVEPTRKVKRDEFAYLLEKMLEI